MMDDCIPLNLAVEDLVSETVIRTIIKQSGRPFLIGRCYGKKGAGYLKSKIRGFNNAAKGIPFFVLTDLDQVECVPILLQSWVNIPLHPNFIFRVAVKEIESWILADRKNFAQYFQISIKYIPKNTDEILDPKRELIKIVSKSKKRDLKEAIVPQKGGTARIGPDYNAKICEFINTKWNVYSAMKFSRSLKKTYDKITNFKGVFD